VASRPLLTVSHESSLLAAREAAAVYGPYFASRRQAAADARALADALQEGAAGRAEQLVGKLVEDTVEHFDVEERLMDAHGYPRSPRAEHCQQHAKFREFIDALFAEIRAGRTSTLRLAFRCQFLLLD